MGFYCREKVKRSERRKCKQMILTLIMLSLALLYIKYVLLCPVDSALVSPLHVFTCIHWIVIYPVDSTIPHFLVTCSKTGWPYPPDKSLNSG